MRTASIRSVPRETSTLPAPPVGGGRGGGRGGGPTEAQKIQAILHDAGVGAVLKPSRGEHGTIFVQTRDLGANAVPSVIVAGEHYNNLIRMLQDRVPVRVRVGIDAKYFTADTSGYNIIAELPGSDPRSQRRGRHDRRAPRLVEFGHRRDRQRRRRGDRARGDAHPQGGRRQAATHDSRRAVGRRGRRALRVARVGRAASRRRREQSGARQVRRLLQHRPRLRARVRLLHTGQ